MKFNEKQLTLENGLTKEWIITNGIGGYASSTIIGANTRKYHGLLVAPLTPPARRFVILSKIDESIEIEGTKYELYTNVCKKYISQGFKYQSSFEKNYLPTFTYNINDIEISKTICLEYEKNSVGILYKIKNGKKTAQLNLAPIVNYRDFHTMNTNHIFDLKQDVKDKDVKLIIDGNSAMPIYMKISDGIYEEHYNDLFYNMFYIEEEKRGFFPEENHSVPGVFKIELKPNEEKNISFMCSLESIPRIDVEEMINNENQRLKKLFDKSLLISKKRGKKTKTELEQDELVKDFLVATDNFVVYRPSFKLHTLIAGYHWFLDWGRDSLISFEGLLLLTNRLDIAKEVLLTYVRDIKEGLVPNGYSGYDNRPLYNSVDASLLLFEEVKKFIDYTNDEKFIKEHIYNKLIEVIENYQLGIDIDNNNIYLDEDNLISSGTESTQNTWMDAKYGDFAATPRNGKAVEINSMWYNALMIMGDLTEKFETKTKAKKYRDLAKKTKKSFNEKFYNTRRKSLFDVLGDSKIRPNQLFALSLTYPVIEPNSEIAKNIMDTVTKKLLNNYGLKTLAKGEKNYVDTYEGDGFRRDMSYHQGITWPWLLGLYYDSLKNMIKHEKGKIKKAELQNQLDEFKTKTKKTFEKQLREEGCIGSISELYDSKRPNLPKGAIAQGWSVAEVFRIILGK
ncbi:MAG: glycogen debranching enzyme N-terminal domain-containing protein [Clostridia bacterium]|nr:glycogen debranching enzyme N-terminal domain-containing protein [Clostridia bacterium]